MIRLENGLTACLISDTSDLKITDSILKEDSSDSDSECSENETDGEESATDVEENEEPGTDVVEIDEEEEARSNARLHGTHDKEEKLVNISVLLTFHIFITNLKCTYMYISILNFRLLQV